MFIPAMILMRLTSPRPIAAGRTRISFKAPSMRNRTRTISSDGSMCTSEVRSRMACVEDAIDHLHDRSIVGHHHRSGGFHDPLA